jgi:hypothetical protein
MPWREIVELLIAIPALGLLGKLWWEGLMAELRQDEKQVIRERIKRMIG